MHPRKPDVLYARTDVGGAYRWDAARRAWQPMNDAFDRANGDLYGVLSLALDPRDPDRVYLACGEYFSEWARAGAFLWSTDRGVSWDGVDLPFKLGGNQDGRGMGERLAVDPHDGRVLMLASSRDGLWRSGDAGRHWRTVSGLPADSWMSFVLFDPASGADGRPTPVLYAGMETTARPALYRSEDGGNTWQAVAGQPAGLMVHHAAVDAKGALYLAYGNGPGPNNVTAGAVWKYEPAAARWTDITPVRPDPAANDGFGYAGIALDLRKPDSLFVSTLDRWTRGDEIFRSDDGGATWIPLLAGSNWSHAEAPYVEAMKPHWISDLAADPYRPGRLWCVTGYGVWATEQATGLRAGEKRTWFFPNRGLEETVIDALVSPPDGAPLLSAVGDLGGFRHDDLNVSPAAGMFRPFHGGNPGIDFAALAPRQLVRTHWGPARGGVSHDGGVTWSDFPATPAAARDHGPGIAAISSDARRLVWLPKGARPYYSTDDGATWTQSRTDLVATKEWQTYGPVADRVDPLKLYIYDPLTGDFFRSEDGGVSFVHTKRLPTGAGQLKAVPGVEGQLWLPTPTGIVVSDDAGRSFRALSGVEVANQLGFGAPAPGRSFPAVYLDGVVRGQGAFWRSDDAGTSWVRISDERLRLGWIRTLTGDPRVYGRVYVGTSGRGILYGEPLPRK